LNNWAFAIEQSATDFQIAVEHTGNRVGDHMQAGLYNPGAALGDQSLGLQVVDVDLDLVEADYDMADKSIGNLNAINTSALGLQGFEQSVLDLAIELGVNLGLRSVLYELVLVFDGDRCEHILALPWRAVLHE
jgi:hypothetical protein